MALNGSIGWSSGGSYNSWGIYVTWSATQNIAGNYSDVTASVSIRSTNAGSWFQRDTDIWLSINGDSGHKVFSNLRLNPNSTVPNVYSRTVRVPHDPNGRKSFELSASMSNATVGTVSVSGSGDLTGIPRAYTFITSSPTSVMDTNYTVKINDNGSGFNARMYLYFGNKKLLANGTMPIGSNYNFMIQSKDFADQIPNSTTGSGSIIIETWNGGTKIGENKYSLTIIVPDSVKPTISSVSYKDVNDIVKNITGSDQILVQGKSFPQMNVQASGIYGSTISQFKFEIGGSTFTNIGYLYTIDLSKLISLKGTQIVKVTVVDSRGRTSTMNYSLYIQGYSPPTISKFTGSRLASPPTTISLIKVVNVSSIKNGSTEKNTYTVVTRYKKGSDTAWVTAKTETNTSANFQMTGFETVSSYDIEVTVTDRFSSYSSKINVGTIITLMDFYKDIGVGIGKVYEPGHGALDVGGMIWMLGRSLIDTFYPIGSIYQSTNSTNPSTFMGGTWERYAKGKVLVGLDESDGDFNTVDKTGGEKDTKISLNNLPDGAIYRTKWTGGTVSYGEWKGGNVNNGTFITSTPYDTGMLPRNAPMENLQPYTTVYMWRRTA